MTSVRSQRTVRQPVAVRGFGYWSGRDVRVEFRPAPAGAGITFVRDDIGPGARIPALADHRIEIPRRTCLRAGMAQVDMVEHVLAALYGLQIDNCEVGVDQAEMPGCDGSALAFVEALDAVGTVAQHAPVNCIEVDSVVRLTHEDSWIEAHPTSDGALTVEFRLDYPADSVIGCQTAVEHVTPASFRREIAPTRTFLLEREAATLVRQGLGQRVTPQDLLVFGPDGPVENHLRFDNECARHKALDVIGDLALTGCQIVGRIVAYRSGHRLNAALARALVRSQQQAGVRAIA